MSFHPLLRLPRDRFPVESGQNIKIYIFVLNENKIVRETIDPGSTHNTGDIFFLEVIIVGLIYSLCLTVFPVRKVFSVRVWD